MLCAVLVVYYLWLGFAVSAGLIVVCGVIVVVVWLLFCFGRYV